jgi:hypothetical protein
MTQRFYISPLAQDSRNRWRPALLDSAAWVAEADGQINRIMTSGFTDGQPDISWSCCFIEAQNHAALGAVEGVYLMPDYSLDGRLSGMEAGAKVEMRTRLTALGVDMALIDNSNSYRDVLAQIAGTLGNSEFEANSLV